MPIWAVRTLLPSKPGLTSWMRAKLLSSSAAPISSTSASAISPMTSVCRVRLVRRLADAPRPSSLSTSCTRPRTSVRPGASPKTMPVTMASAP